MIRPNAPSGISHEALHAAICDATAHGLDRSDYEAWAECTLLGTQCSVANQTVSPEPLLAAATNLTMGGLELLVRRPLARGTLALVRLIQPDATAGPNQSVVVCSTMPTHDRRWSRCELRYIHMDDLPPSELPDHP